jgi:hypothetical protein
MTGFAVIRHPETGGVGTAPADAMDLYRAGGWVRVSEYRAEPSDFNLPDFTDATDLDAPAVVDTKPESDVKPAKPSKESKA